MIIGATARSVKQIAARREKHCRHRRSRRIANSRCDATYRYAPSRVASIGDRKRTVIDCKHSVCWRMYSSRLMPLNILFLTLIEMEGSTDMATYVNVRVTSLILPNGRSYQGATANTAWLGSCRTRRGDTREPLTVFSSLSCRTPAPQSFSESQRGASDRKKNCRWWGSRTYLAIRSPFVAAVAVLTGKRRRKYLCRYKRRSILKRMSRKIESCIWHRY